MQAQMKDVIQTIPTGLEKYLGIGEMLLPSKETIRKKLATVPEGKLTTIPALRESIAAHFEVTTACPKTSLKMLRNLMQEKSSGAYRVLNGKGELIAADPELQAELLKAEGFDIDDSKAKYKVKDFKNFLVN